MSIVKRAIGFVSRFFNRASLAVLAALTISAYSAFGQEQAGDFDFSAAETAATDLGNSLKDFLTDHVVPAVLVVVAAFAALLLIYRVVRWLFKAMSGK